MKRTLFILVLVALVGFVTAAPAAAQNYGYTEEMTMEEYEAELQKWQQREQEAQAQVEQLQQDIADLKDQIAQTEEQIANVRQETINLLSSAKGMGKNETETALEEYYSAVDALISDLEGLLALSPEELYQRQEELEALARRLEELKSNLFSNLDEAVEKLNRAENLLQRVQAKMPKPMNDIYTVLRGDYLWKISGKEDIYEDPYQWVKIWSANREQIDDPDLIYPEQKFDIPRRLPNNQRIVKKGEHLSKIAGYEDVYGSPFEWQKIYEANKKIITDPNVVYPHQILVIPKE